MRPRTFHNTVTQWSEHKRGTAVLALFVFLGFVLYLPALSAPFIFDDFSTIVDNPFIKRFDLPALWQSDPSRFLTNLTFTVNYLVFGLNPLSWHVLNLTLHIAAAFFIFKLSRLVLVLPRLNGRFSYAEQEWSAFVVGLLFLVHPVQTQAVIYTVQRSTILCTLLTVLGLYYYLRWRLDTKKNTWGVPAALTVGGMMTKPLFMIFPLLVLLAEFFGFGQDKPKDRRHYAMYVFACLPMVVIPLFLLGLEELAALAYTGFQSASWMERSITQLNVLMTYLRLLVWPVGLNLEYHYPLSRSLFSFPTFVSFIGAVALAALAWRLVKKEPLISFGILWFLIALIPVMVFPLNDLIFEHWLYLPLAGFAFIIGRLAIVPISVGHRLWQAAGLILMCLMGVLTYQRSALWAKPEMLMQDAVVRSPGNARAYNNLGLIYLKQKRFAQAQEAFYLAQAADPQYFIARNNLALVYLEEGRLKESRAVLEELIRQFPGYADAYLNLAQIAEKMKEDDKALMYALRGLELKPLEPMAYLTIGNIYQNQKMFTQAREAYQKAVWLKPESPAAFYNLGNVCFKEGNFFEALQYYEKARKLDPGMLEAYVNAGNVYYYFGDHKAAIEEYRQAIDRGAMLPEAYFNMANALYAIGSIDESQVYIRKAAVLYQQQGRPAEAERIMRKLEGSVP